MVTQITTFDLCLGPLRVSPFAPFMNSEIVSGQRSHEMISLCL